MCCTLAELNRTAGLPEMGFPCVACLLACSLVTASMAGRLPAGLALTRDWASKTIFSLSVDQWTTTLSLIQVPVTPELKFIGMHTRQQLVE
jgi:hypothetical protein